MGTSDNNKGQSDKKYDPPVGVVRQAVTFNKQEMKENTERNKDYDKGWANADKQIKK